MKIAIPPTAPAPQPAASRMRLDALVRGKLEQPTRMVIHGVDGVGKSTFAASAPAPVFIGAEDGTAQLDVARFPAPTTWAEILEAVETLTRETHDFKTVVIDSLDWAEPLCWRHLADAAKVKSIEEVGGGYGKGYVAAADEWRILLRALDRLREKRKMHVICIAHSAIKLAKSPTSEDFDRYVIKLHERSAGLIREWADVVGFAIFEVVVEKAERSRRVRGLDTGARLLHTTYSAAYDAKNRYGLPPTMPLDWTEFYAAVRAGHLESPEDLRASIRSKAEKAGGELATKAIAYLEKAGDDALKLAQVENWIAARLTTAGTERKDA